MKGWTNYCYINWARTQSFLHALLRLMVPNTKKRAVCSEFMNLIMYVEIALDFCNTCQFITPQGDINLRFVFFQFEYCNTIHFVPDILCLSKGCLMHDKNDHRHFCSPESHMNLHRVVLACNNATFSIFFLNESLFLH